MVRQLDAQLHIDGHSSTVSLAAANCLWPGRPYALLVQQDSEAAWCKETCADTHPSATSLAAAKHTHPVVMAQSQANCCVFVVQVEDLKRFIPRLLHIWQAGAAAAGQAHGNVTSAQLLTDAFGVHS